MNGVSSGVDSLEFSTMALALLERPSAITNRLAELLARQASAHLHVRPADIVFRNVAPGRVKLSVTVANIGNARSEPTTMTIQAAPLGAFVAWKDVTSLDVPAIEPFGSVEISTELTAPPPTKTLGQFSRVPPSKLLTAIAGGDERPRPANPLGNAWAQFFARLLGRRKPDETAYQLPDDPLRLLSRPSIHWAGNINVLIGRQAVERHLAQALRIYPGSTNLAMFFVGNRRDEYEFTLWGDGAAWDTELLDFSNIDSFLRPNTLPKAIPQSKWIPMDGCRMVMLAICPPSGAETGSIEVHVRQRSTGQEAVVEFSLDANAAGAGCYTI